MKKKNIKVVVVIVLCLCSVFIGAKIYKNTKLSTYSNSTIEVRYKESDKISHSIKQIKKSLDEFKYDYFNNNVRIEHGWMTSGGGLSKYEMEALNRDYIKFSKSKKQNKDIEELTLGVGILKFFNGEYDDAIDMLNNLQESENEEIRAIASLNLALMEMNIYNFEESLNILSRNYNCEFYNYYRDRIVAFEKYLMIGEINELKKYEEYTVSKKPLNEKLEVYLNALGDIKNNIQSVIMYNDERKETNNTLWGVMKDGNKPLRGVVIALKEISNTGMSSGLYIDDKIFAVTDKNGYYKIENIPNGSYRAGVTGFKNIFEGKQLRKSRELNFNGNTSIKEDIQLYDAIKVKELVYIDKDNIKVSWKNFGEEPLKYNVSFSEIMADSTGREKVNKFGYTSIETKEKEIVIDIDDLKKNSIGDINTWSNGRANLDSIMESGYHGGKYAVKIYAIHDESKYSYFATDNYGIVSSQGYDSIEIKGKKWHEGDKLILDKKCEEAIEWFEEEYKKDSTDLHTLKILSALYSNVLEYEGKYERGARDAHKGIKYTEELKKQIGSNYIIEYRLGKLYDEIGEYEKSKEHYKRLAEEYKSYYEYNVLAKILLKEGKYEEALDNFKLYEENSDYDHVYVKIITLSILLNREEDIREFKGRGDDKYKTAFEECLSMDKSNYKKFYEYIENGKIKEAKESLRNDNSDLGKLYKALLITVDSYIDSETHKKEEYEVICRSIENQLLSKIALYLGSGIR